MILCLFTVLTPALQPRRVALVFEIPSFDKHRHNFGSRWTLWKQDKIAFKASPEYWIFTEMSMGLPSCEYYKYKVSKLTTIRSAKMCCHIGAHLHITRLHIYIKLQPKTLWKGQHAVAVHNRFSILCDELEGTNTSSANDLLTTANRDIALKMLPKRTSHISQG